MAFPGVSDVPFRLTSEGDGRRLKFTHRAMGPIPEEVRKNVGHGWDYGLKRIADIASRLVAGR